MVLQFAISPTTEGQVDQRAQWEQVGSVDDQGCDLPILLDQGPAKQVDVDATPQALAEQNPLPPVDADRRSGSVEATRIAPQIRDQVRAIPGEVSHFDNGEETDLIIVLHGPSRLEASTESSRRWVDSCDLLSVIGPGQRARVRVVRNRHGHRAADREIAEHVAAFANADGGTLLVGVEDDGAVTGHGYAAEAIEVMLAAPAQRLTPPVPGGEVVLHEDREVLLFEVTSAEHAVMVIGDGYPRRVGDGVLQESEQNINAIKARTRAESVEGEAVPGANLELLDLDLVRRAQTAAGLAALTTGDYLIVRKLAERRGEGTLLRLGALLLFAQLPHTVPHPNAGVRVFTVRGTERRTGADLNVVEVPRAEGALPVVIEQAYGTIGQRIRKSVRLHDLFFRETPEYPTFAWQEALVNAVAHRDYRLQGRGVEVWMFDDRIEISSPGPLLAGVEIDALRQRRPAHASRNPRVARVLAELGFMREQGEGIPRMFAEMERSLLRLPELHADASAFTVVLRNEPIFESADPAWVQRIEALPIGNRQRRALVAFTG